MKRNGHYSNGRQRWFCFRCQHSFHWKLLSNKFRNEQVWFRKWITEGFSIRQLHQISPHSSAKIRQIIDRGLKCPPAVQSSLNSYRYLIFDGTFLFKRKGVLALMDADSHSIIEGQYGLSENSIPQLLSFFEPLKKQGLDPKSLTVDGNPQVINVIKTLWPHAIVQRCIIHIQRQGLMWCRKSPNRTEAIHLRQIFLTVPSISDPNQLNQFLNSVQKWEEKYGTKLHQLPEKGWVLSDLKRARSMLLRALPDMFHYLNDPQIPTSTNGLEGYFSRLKHNYRQHRGLSPSKRNLYFKWYFSLKPR